MSRSGVSPRQFTQETLETVRRLAALQRPPGSDGERAAAELLARELKQRGVSVRVERERVHGTYWVPIGISSLLAALGGIAPSSAAAGLGLAATLSIADELNIGRRPLRRILRQRIAHNVVAEISPGGPATHTLVIHAHHDAARTGLVFHPAIAKHAARLAGGLIERVGATPAPMWGAVQGPAMVCAGGILRSRRLRLAGAALSAGFASAMANIAFSPAVPGANDNLSGVAVLLELAEALSRHPPNLRVLMLSTGSEESFLEAMVRFGERHFDSLPPAGTTFLCLESVGSPELMLLSGEGLLRLRRYPDHLIKTMSSIAAQTGVRLRSPFRYRLATDGQVPLLAGYPVAVISSMDWYNAPSNYHWPTDRPENLDLNSLAAAATLAEAFIRHLEREHHVA